MPSVDSDPLYYGSSFTQSMSVVLQVCCDNEGADIRFVHRRWELQSSSPPGGVAKPRIEVGKLVLRIPIRPSPRWWRLLVIVLVQGDLVLQVHTGNRRALQLATGVRICLACVARLRYPENQEMPRLLISWHRELCAGVPCRCYQEIISLWVQHLALHAWPATTV